MERPNWMIQGFCETVIACNLQDIPTLGHQFTWERGCGGDNMVEERLDRALVSAQWLALFPNARLNTLVAPISDHEPILLETEVQTPALRYKPFRFENKWFCEPDIWDVVTA